jgi:glucose/mannose-6-phosphate isomerase
VSPTGVDGGVDEAILDDQAAIEAADPQGMLRQVATSGAQLRSALTAAADADLASIADGPRPRAMVVTGMGGSGVSGDILSAVVGATGPVPLFVHRGFGLPGWVGAADLVAAVSCSGTTEETLSAAEEAARRGARLFGVGAADSPLADLVTRARAPYVVVPGGRQPRAALWDLSGPLLVAADALGLAEIPATVVNAAADLLDEISQRCRPGSETFVNPAKTLAVDLSGALPVVWGSSRLAGVAAYRLSCQLAENAAYPSVVGELPEAGHNQVVTLEGAFAGGASASGGVDEDDFFRDRVDESVGPARMHVVMLTDPDEHPRVTARRTVILEMARERGVRVTELAAEGSSPLERLASLVSVTDYVSVYLAVLLGVDPTPVAPLTELKARVAK